MKYSDFTTWSGNEATQTLSLQHTPSADVNVEGLCCSDYKTAVALQHCIVSTFNLGTMATERVYSIVGVTSTVFKVTMGRVQEWGNIEFVCSGNQLKVITTTPFISQVRPSLKNCLFKVPGKFRIGKKLKYKVIQSTTKGHYVLLYLVVWSCT